MTSGLPSDKKSAIRQKFASGEVGREKLMKAGIASYHPGLFIQLSGKCCVRPKAL